MLLSIIVPLFNEERTISRVLSSLKKIDISGVEKEIIVVDDGSTDSSLKKINKKGIKLIRILKNTGKGNAVRIGIKSARGEYITIQDADLEYDPKYFSKLLAPILNKQSKVVYGTRINRLPNKKYERNTRLFFHYLANRTLSLLTSILYFTWVTDIETGYKIFPREAVSDLKSNGFEIEAELTAKLLKKGYKIMEVEISTSPRTKNEGKKFKTLQDGALAFINIIKFRFSD